MTGRSGGDTVAPPPTTTDMTLRTRLTDTLARSSTAPSLLVVSDTYVGSALAADFDAVADLALATDRQAVATAAPDGVRTVVGDLTTVETLAAVSDATVAVLALSRDRRTLLVAQLLRTRFGVDDVVVLLNDPDRGDVFAETATVVCGTTRLADALGDAVERTLSEPTESHS